MLRWIFGLLPVIVLHPFVLEVPKTLAQGNLGTTIQIQDGFAVEKVYEVAHDQGSWVAMCFDHLGRIYASDQGDRLFRVSPHDFDAEGKCRLQVVSDRWGHSQGMSFINGALYLIQHGERSDPNDPNRIPMRRDALLRIRDTDGDDQLDTAEELLVFPRVEGDAENWVEHSLHAVIPSPDGKSLFIISGDRNGLPCEQSRTPRTWNRDSWDFPFVDNPYPGGWILKTDLDGQNPEIQCVGLRNCYDIAFNRSGDLFTYDSDLENDFGLPNYRPTAIRHALSGTYCGWGGQAGQMLWSWSPDWEDIHPPVVNLGPGSPTGICFGYGAKFPTKYQNALFACDWSYGRMFCIHLTPNGASYSAQAEPFLSAQGLPIADVAVSPTDGDLYFLTGGRGTQSAIYRVTYLAKDSLRDEAIAVSSEPTEHSLLRELRESLELFHGRQDSTAVEKLWTHLGHEDRSIRAAARAALESQPSDTWASKALTEIEPRKGLQALLSLARTNDHRPDVQPQILEALKRWDLTSLPVEEQRWYLRILTVTASRHGHFAPEIASPIIQNLEKLLPSTDRIVNQEIVSICVGLNSPTILAPCLDLFCNSRTQEEQVLYMKGLTAEYLVPFWTPELRVRWLQAVLEKVPYWKGGFTARARRDEYLNRTIQRLTESERLEFKDQIASALIPQKAIPIVSRPFVRNWTSQDFEVGFEEQLAQHRDLLRGKELFSQVSCIRCHGFQGEGGMGGPDLTHVGKRYTPADLLDNILHPSRVINEQYGMQMYLMKDGTVITGRTVNRAGGTVMVTTNPNDPGGSEVRFQLQDLESTSPSNTSFMPAGLLDSLSRDEVLDLLAYLLQQ